MGALKIVLAHDLKWDFTFGVKRVQVILVFFDPTGKGSLAGAVDDKLDVRLTVKNFVPMVDNEEVLSLTHLW